MTPREAAERSCKTRLPDGDGDRAVGYGVMGVPFADGTYLALRCWPSSSFGPGYSSVWVGDRIGWTVYSDAPPEQSCARFIGAAVDRIVTASIELQWTSPHQLRVTVDDRVDWSLTLTGSVRTGMLNACATLMPARAWRSRAVLAGMGRLVGPMLGLGRLRLAGTMPNGHDYLVAARSTWRVAHSKVRVGDKPIGQARRASPQTRLGTLWLPRRGLFYADTTALMSPPAPSLVEPAHPDENRQSPLTR